MSGLTKISIEIESRPFIRWAGGKTSLLSCLENKLPKSFKNYHEPFLGGGAFFFHLSSLSLIRKAYLNDLNEELINSYKQIKKDPESIIAALSILKNDKISYYKIREKISEDKLQSACRFLYLNRTSFNGIYRVNKNGIYNVPYGNKKYKTLFDYDNMRNVSRVLKLASITSVDFFHTLKNIQKGDLVFIDPPYTVAHENNGFIEYNQQIFTWDDQKRLLEYIKEIRQIGAKYIMTNASHQSIYSLFKPIGKPYIMERYSVVGGKKAFRGTIHEYLFTNI